MIEPGSDKQRIECEGAFATVGPERFEDTTGAKWVWLTANGHWCRKESSSLLTAWVETAAGGKATHKLTVNGGEQPSVFQPLPSR